MGRQFKIASTNGVSDHLKALEKKGYIRRVGKRAIEVVNALGKSVLTATQQVPVLGRVPAGKPFHSEENIEGVITIPTIWAGENIRAPGHRRQHDRRRHHGRRPGDRKAARHDRKRRDRLRVDQRRSDLEALL